jgi:hypothetical protein
MLVKSTGPNILITRIMLNNVWGRTGSLTFCTSGSGGPSDTAEKVTYDVVLLIFVLILLGGRANQWIWPNEDEIARDVERDTEIERDTQEKGGEGERAFYRGSLWEREREREREREICMRFGLANL